MTVKLYDSPRMKTLLAVLPTDADRDDATADVVRRERQYHALRDRAAAIDARCREIAEALPDASAKDAKALQSERRDLLAERAALPLDLRVVARLYADALGEWASLVLAHVAGERRIVLDELAKTDKPLGELTHTLQTATPGTPAHDSAYERFKALQAERKPATDRRADLEELREMVRTYTGTALASESSSARPGGVKLMQDGRPIAAHVAGFIADAAKVA